MYQQVKPSVTPTAITPLTNMDATITNSMPAITTCTVGTALKEPKMAPG